MRPVGILQILLLALIAGFAFVYSCGGGGGGGGSDIHPSIPYSGADMPAFITSQNAVNLATGAYLGMNYIEQTGEMFPLSSESIPGPYNRIPVVTYLFSSKILSNDTISTLQSGNNGKAVQLETVDDYLEGSCDGHIVMHGFVNEENRTFDINVIFENFSDDCELYLSGRTNVVGSLDYDIYNMQMTITMEALALTSGDVSLTQAGTWSIDSTVYPHRENIDIVTRDESTGKTYWMNNYEILTEIGAEGLTNYFDMSISGRYYDPDYGFVEVMTEIPLRLMDGDLFPGEGVLVLTGEGGSGARLEVISNAAHSTSCDENGDGLYDEFDSGIVHWPGQNNVPLAIASKSGQTGLYCTVTLDAAESYDIDSDPIVSYFWSVVSLPEGSQASLSDPGSPTPTFTPDVPGEYEFRLSISDGIGDSYETGYGCNVSSDDRECVNVSDDFGCPYEGMELFDVGSDPHAVAIGDINSDGRNDVILTTDSYFDPENDYHLFVFYQDENGQLSSPLKYSTINSENFRPAAVDIGDLNDDGRNDVVIAREYSIGIFYQNDSAALGSMVTFEADMCISASIGDLNGDDLQDVACSGLSGINVFYQDSVNGIQPPVVYESETSWSNLSLGDFNHDGRTDIAAGAGGNIGILLQAGDGTIDSPVFYSPVGVTSRGMAAGDVNGDGRDDILINYLGGVQIMYQNQSGTLDAGINLPDYGHAGHRIKVGDINADGRGDVVVTQEGWQRLEIFRQSPSGTLGAYELYLGPFFNWGNSQGIAIGDINGNGINDIVVAETTYRMVVMYDSIYN